MKKSKKVDDIRQMKSNLCEIEQTLFHCKEEDEEAKTLNFKTEVETHDLI